MNDTILSCGVSRTLQIIGKKWTILILRDLMDGTKRFNQLQKSLGTISPKTLSERLSELEQDQIVNKKYLQKFHLMLNIH